MSRHIACSDASVIPSSDGIDIALHDLGGSGRPLLLAHATGFHAHCWRPLADALVDRYRVFAFDHRGHGDADPVDPAELRWTGYGDDALAAARRVSELCGGEPIAGVGHSMGGASLLMAAQREPALFRALYVFEPIVFPPRDPAGPGHESPLPAGARRRRATFPDATTALENFAAKPPMSTFHPLAREEYVRHGFAPSSDGGIELKCAPEHEARTYETGSTSGAWETLPSIAVPVRVLAGALAPFQPSSFAAAVAERIPGATFVRWDEAGHFGPLERPDLLANYVRAVEAGRDPR